MAHDGALSEDIVHTPPTDKEVNAHVGERLRLARVTLGLRLTDVAERSGLDFQLISKYERAQVRIAVDTLVKLARVLKQPIAFFYEGLDE